MASDNRPDGNRADGGWERPLWAEIDLDALSHNVQKLSHQAGEAKLAAVVKADAYGHGAVQIARAVLAAGAERLAVINVVRWLKAEKRNFAVCSRCN